MDMMRQAMGNMGYGAKAGSSDAMVNPMAPDELEKRIAELRVVENWLKLNLSMLSSTIQGMEVQMATVKTLQSFVAMGQSGNTAGATDASPLEIALGLKPAPSASKQPEKAKAPAAPTSDAPAAAANPQASAEDPQQAAAQNWWNMLEGQFAQIAAATANAAKMGSETLQKTTQAQAKAQTAAQTAAKAATKRATPVKPRAAKKTAKSTRTPKKQA